MRPGLQFSQPGPGPATGGWETVGVGHVLQNNCDGYRIYTGYNEWEGVVLTQASDSDYDLTVHYALEGVKDGFDDLLSRSAIWGGHSDFVLFNNNLLPSMAHDIGVENWQGNDPYTIEAVGSTNLPVPPTGTHGPFTMPISNMLHLHNIYLEPDLYAFRLDNLAGAPDWAFSLHPHNVSRPVRQQTVPSGASNQSAPGGPEWFTVDILTAGYYGLAVYKDRPVDFDVEGTYELTILRGVSDVPDEQQDLPAATALCGVHPNPFNPQTTISYELAVSADVDLAIYDLKGALVRRLVHEGVPAGRHEAVWDGKDDGGTRAASGVYLARFAAGSHREVAKVVMVK
jgi:hypothetical protein